MSATINSLAFGMMFGIIPCIIWGMIDGDEGFRYPKLKPLLKFIHHWQIGIIIMIVGSVTNAFILGWGTGTAIDDLFFHSFENYFVKKPKQEREGNNENKT